MEHADVLAAISASLLDIVRRLGRIEEEVRQLKSLSDVNDAPDDDAQSVLGRVWDPVSGQWVYSPE